MEIKLSFSDEEIQRNTIAGIETEYEAFLMKFIVFGWRLRCSSVQHYPYLAHAPALNALFDKKAMYGHTKKKIQQVV